MVMINRKFIAILIACIIILTIIPQDEARSESNNLSFEIEVDNPYEKAVKNVVKTQNFVGSVSDIEGILECFFDDKLERIGKFFYKIENALMFIQISLTTGKYFQKLNATEYKEYESNISSTIGDLALLYLFSISWGGSIYHCGFQVIVGMIFNEYYEEWKALGSVEAISYLNNNITTSPLTLKGLMKGDGFWEFILDVAKNIIEIAIIIVIVIVAVIFLPKLFRKDYH